MKIRNGFVSNSSSSSFVVIGFPYSQLTNKMRKKYLENKGVKLNEDDSLLDVFWDTCNENNIAIYTEYNDIIGIEIAGNDGDDQLESKEFSSNDLIEVVTQLVEEFDLSDDISIKLYTGMRAS